MKISKYRIYDDGSAIGAEGAIFAAGKLEVAGSPDASIRWTGVPVKDIVSVVFAADVEADAAHQRDVTFATNPSAGDEFVVTIQYQDSRQRVRKPFKYVAVAGATVTTIAAAIKDLINASDAPFSATNASGVLTITADVAGAGYDPTIDGGSDSATTTVTVEAIGSATLDAVRDTAAALAAKHEGVDADDFGTLTAAKGYQQYYITYTELVPTAHGKVLEERVAAIFIDGDTATTALDDALNADWTPTATDGGAAVVTASKGRNDLLA
jgi:hypothetical protein